MEEGWKDQCWLVVVLVLVLVVQLWVLIIGFDCVVGHIVDAQLLMPLPLTSEGFTYPPPHPTHPHHPTCAGAGQCGRPAHLSLLVKRTLRGGWVGGRKVWRCVLGTHAPMIGAAEQVRQIGIGPTPAKMLVPMATSHVAGRCDC